MDSRTLGRLIRRLILVSLSTPLLAGAGCVPPGPDPALFSPPVCEGGSRLHVTGLMPAAPVDYIALRENGFDAMTARTVSETGTKCKSARDMATCQTKLAALPATPGFNTCVDHPCEHTLATTQADDVRVIADAAGVVSFLAPVDAPQEAVLIAYANDYDVSCTERESGGVRPAPDGDGFEVLASRMTKDCAPIEITGYHLKVSKAGTVTVLSQRVLNTSPACVGRRPPCMAGPERSEGQEGLGPIEGAAPGAGCTAVAPELVAVGDYFAEVARLEAASVTAFHILRDELRAHGAPSELVAEAERAAADEVRHARITAALAARYGAEAGTAVPTDRPALRPLLAMALENAVEGCVRETFGALVGAFQAATAQDPEVAATMAQIAEDEARHAALAWQVAAWITPRLDAGSLEQVRAAQRQAVADLRRELAAPVAASLVARGGVPEPARAIELLDGMAAELWAV